MVIHKGSAIWHDGLKNGKGNMSTESGALNATYSYGSRFEDDKSGTNPEELIGAAHAGCFSIYLSSVLEKHEHKPKHIRTEARVSLDKDEKGPLITKIELIVEASVENVTEEDFQEHVKFSKENCPVSRAVACVPEITVKATLLMNE